ncbi:MAG: hypothetical protein IJ448_01470 [Oscillospiraceae bacterium]|nr:hypothetical protein [Oscillospiraceae bacterium]
MARYKLQGMEEYEKVLSGIASAAEKGELAGAAIYAGADVVADAIREGIQALPEVDHRKHGSASDQLDGITSAQKAGLLEGFGITSMRNDDGFFNVKLGFDGYNRVKTRQWPSGQPNAMIARSINSGTSFRKKTRFVDIATRKAKPQAEKAMAEAFDHKLEQAMK